MRLIYILKNSFNSLNLLSDIQYYKDSISKENTFFNARNESSSTSSIFKGM